MHPIKYKINYIYSRNERKGKINKINFSKTIENIKNIQNLKELKSLIVYDDVAFEMIKKRTNAILEPKLPDLLRRISEYYQNYDWTLNLSINSEICETFKFHLTLNSENKKITPFIVSSNILDSFDEYLKTIENLNTDNFILFISIPKYLWHRKKEHPYYDEAIPSICFDFFNFIDEIKNKNISPLFTKNVFNVEIYINLFFGKELEWSVVYIRTIVPDNCSIPDIIVENKSLCYSILDNNKSTFLKTMIDSGVIKSEHKNIENITDDNVYEILEYIKIVSY